MKNTESSWVVANMAMTEAEELERIIAQNEELTASAKGKSWSGYRGMVFVNLLRDYLEKHLPSSVGLVCRGWVEGLPFFRRLTWSNPWERSTWSHRRDTSSLTLSAWR